MKVKDLAEELQKVDKDYGNLVINKGAEDIDLKICDDTLVITILSDRKK